MRGIVKGRVWVFLRKTYFNFFSSCQSMAMPMNAAPVSAMGCAKNTPFNSKKCGRMSKNGISKITWRQAFRNMARSAFPVPWKKFPDTIPQGIMKFAWPTQRLVAIRCRWGRTVRRKLLLSTSQRPSKRT